MVVFNERMRPEVIQPFWAAVQRGEFITEAAESVGTYRVKGGRWILAAAGCVRAAGVICRAAICRSQSARRSRWAAPRGVGAVHRAAAGTLAVDRLARAVAQRRSPRGVSRDDRARAGVGARQSPKPAKLGQPAVARDRRQLLERKFSPEQIAGRLRRVPR